MRVLISSLLLLLPLMLMSRVSSSQNPGVARGNRDQRQALGRRLREGGGECECKDWFLRAPQRKLMTVPRLPKKRCPCDHSTVNVKKTILEIGKSKIKVPVDSGSGHQRHHRKSNKHSRACQQFLKRCQLESFALPL